ALLDRSAIVLPEDLPPMAAGVFGYMGYDTVRLIEHLPNPRPDALGVPDAILMRPMLMVIFDAVKDDMTLVTPVRPAEGISPRDAYQAAQARLAGVVAALDAPLAHQAATSSLAPEPPEPVSNTTPAEFMAM